MSVLFIGKRFYTNRDAFTEHYGRIFQLPRYWSQMKVATSLWLVDYHTHEAAAQTYERLDVISTPVRDLSILRHYLTLTDKKLERNNPKVVVASGDCYIGLLGYWVARKFNARFVFDIYDKYDEFTAYVRFPGFDLFRYLLRRADFRLFASRPLMNRIGLDANRDFVVANGINSEMFRPLDMNLSRVKFGLASRLTIAGYFGSMDESRGIDDLLQAQEILRSSGFTLHLLVGGKLRRGLNLDRENVHYLGNLNYAQVPSALACCDLLVLPYRRSTYLDMASSCKIAEYMAAGRPIVSTRTPNIMRNFPLQAGELGKLMAEPANPADLARALRDQASAKRIVALPEEMRWRSIAAYAAVSLGLASPPDHGG